MTNHSGVVAVENGGVHVTVGLGGTVVQLLAGDSKIGEWDTHECEITDNGDGTFAIAAEEETLSFMPDDPASFALGLSEIVTRPVVDQQVGTNPASSAVSDDVADGDTIEIVESPPPRKLTMVAFYAIAALTAVLGIWALITLMV